MDKYLELKGVHFNYFTRKSEFNAINNLSFCVDRGEFISIVGPSGCGKTTILSLIAGLYEPTSGEILLEGKKINNIDIGYMFQKDQLFEWRTIYKNITLGLELKDRSCINKERDRIDCLLKKYGIFDFKNKYPRELSGGMRQRVALIRTLAVKPKILLLDEPFSALDYQTRLDLCDDVKRIITEQEQTAILVTHDISEAVSLSDRVIVLTKRPAEIKQDIKLDFTTDLTPFERRKDVNFSNYFNYIWRTLNEER